MVVTNSFWISQMKSVTLSIQEVVFSGCIMPFDYNARDQALKD